MKSQNLIRIAALGVLLAVSSNAALAKTKTPPPAQTHHCKTADGTVDPKMSKKACLKAKGTWAKDEAPPKS